MTIGEFKIIQDTCRSNTGDCKNCKVEKICDRLSKGSPNICILDCVNYYEDLTLLQKLRVRTIRIKKSDTV